MKGKYQILVERIAKATGTKLGFIPLADFPKFVWPDSQFVEDDIWNHPHIEEMCEKLVKRCFIGNGRNTREPYGEWYQFRSGLLFDEFFVDTEAELDLKLTLMGV